jgi:hypothetical protein
MRSGAFEEGAKLISLSIRRVPCTSGSNMISGSLLVDRDVIASYRSGGHILGICKGGNGKRGNAIYQADC